MDKQPRNGDPSPDQVDGRDEVSSAISLENLSQSNQQSSAHNRRSLIQVMSIDGGDMDQDIYQYYLIDESRKVSQRSSNNSRRESNNENSMEDEGTRRHSSHSRSVQHECNCEGDDCLQYHCTCYNSPNEMCVDNSCCPKCIQLKLNQLQLKRTVSQVQLFKGVKNPVHNCFCAQILKVTGNTNYICKNCILAQPTGLKDQKKVSKLKTQDPTKSVNGLPAGCSCKKSHCLKKYCCCFATGQRCGLGCQCEQCLNMDELKEEKDQKCEDVVCGVEEIDIDQYLEGEKYSDIAMPQSMEFQLPNLRMSYHY